MDDKHYRARITKRADLAPDLWMIHRGNRRALSAPECPFRWYMHFDAVEAGPCTEAQWQRRPEMEKLD